MLFQVVRVVVFFALATTSRAAPPSPSASQWAAVDQAGELRYEALSRGDRVMDFSFAGYGGGGTAIPSIPTRVTVKPSGADDTVSIQRAIDALSMKPLKDGFRGAVQLEPGVYICSNTLTLKSSGIVLRGSGSGTDGTVIRMTEEPHPCLSIGVQGRVKTEGTATVISDAYVPSGTTGFTVENATGFRAGDTILISRPVTADWIRFMHMDGLVRDGKKQTWLSENSEIIAERVVKRVAGKQLTVEVPLSDSYDRQLLGPQGARVTKCLGIDGLNRVGVENLRIVAPPQPVEISQRHHQAIRMNQVNDGWLRNIQIVDTVNSVSLGAGACRITVEGVGIAHTVATRGAAKPADFSVSGSQVLLHRCSARGDNLFFFVTGARVTGPNVLLNCTFTGKGAIQPHARWATGLLVDGCKVPEGSIDFMNRGEMGSGHGWTVGWAVAWNCEAKSYTVQQPPGSANWAIGCVGTRPQAGMPFGHRPALPEGTFDSHGTPVQPVSLYLAQLGHRLGREAVQNVTRELLPTP